MGWGGGGTEWGVQCRGRGLTSDERGYTESRHEHIVQIFTASEELSHHIQISTDGTCHRKHVLQPDTAAVAARVEGERGSGVEIKGVKKEKESE